MIKKRFLYTLKDRDKIPIYQCFHYKQAKAYKILYKIEYDKELTLHRIEY